MSITVPLEGFGGGGGASLNFDVKAYATEEALLAATPSKYTVGIITEVPLNGWAFTATEPTEPVEGIVWISTGTSSAIEFNALKKNAIQVYPLSAKQYVSGAWNSVEAMSYQGGEWKYWWDGTLYDYGKRYTEITGELILGAATASGTLNYADDYIRITASGVSGNSRSYYFENTFDLTNVESIDVTFACSSGDRGWLFVQDTNFEAISYVRTSGPTITTKSIDTSSIVGEHYICFSIGFGESATFTLDVYRVKLNSV